MNSILEYLNRGRIGSLEERLPERQGAELVVVSTIQLLYTVFHALLLDHLKPLVHYGLEALTGEEIWIS